VSCGILAQESFHNVLSHYRSKNIYYNKIIDKIGFQALTRADVMELRNCLFDYYMFGLKEVNKPLLEALRSGLWETLDKNLFEKYFTAEDIGILMAGGSGIVKGHMLVEVFKFRGYEKKKNSEFWLHALKNLDMKFCQR
jgi:hypothetical protein